MNTYEVIVDVECWYVIQVEAESEAEARRIVEADELSRVCDYEYGDHSVDSIREA